MAAESGKLRVHLFYAYDIAMLQNCVGLKLFADKRGNRVFGYPRDLAKIRPNDYAIIWSRFGTWEIRGVWTIVAAAENVVTDEWCRNYPIQARVELLTNSMVEDRSEKLQRLLSVGPGGKKRDYYDDDEAQAILNSFGVTDTSHSVVSRSNEGRVQTSVGLSSNYRPPFFEAMLETKDWSVFEDYSHALLRTLGIHNLHAFARDKQAGQSDGVFTIGNMAVIYDATLNTNPGSKDKQIQNYIEALKRDELTISSTHSEPINDRTAKRVWLLVRETSRPIKTVGNIKVSYVDVRDLMSLCEQRIADGILLDDLVDKLGKLGTVR